MFFKREPEMRTLIELGADRTIETKWGQLCDEKYEQWVKSCSNIIWLDLELTSGFYEGPLNARVLECAIVITDKDMNELDHGHWVSGYVFSIFPDFRLIFGRL